jgi:hypothetical protein
MFTEADVAERGNALADTVTTIGSTWSDASAAVEAWPIQKPTELERTTRKRSNSRLLPLLSWQSIDLSSSWQWRDDFHLQYSRYTSSLTFILNGATPLPESR